MAVSLAFHFPGGRYHATPYGHHVNEGLIEWPPSPWRLLRALISVGFTSGVWNGSGPTPTGRTLIEKMASELPRYYLPPSVSAHSRHYMPTGVLDAQTRIEKATLVFDTWARIDDPELVVMWTDSVLDEEEAALLAVLTERMNYLGRSESWVRGRVLEGVAKPPPSNCFAEGDGKTLGSGWEQVPLLAPENPSDFTAWRQQELGNVLADLSMPHGKRPSKALLRKRGKATEPYPDDLLDCLQKDTTWTRAHGWSQPPGSRRVLYWRPANAITVGAPRTQAPVSSAQRVEAMLLSMTNNSRNDHALPPITRTIPQAELLHRALVSIASRTGEPPAELTGRDELRQRLRGPHTHAHINPLDLDDDGHLDHVLIWAPAGLGAAAQAAIRATRRTFTKGGVEPLRLAVAARSELQGLTALPDVYGRRMARLISDGQCWQTVTPFVPPRHLKARGKNTLEGQIRAELRSRGFPEPEAVIQLAPVPSSTASTGAAAGTGRVTKTWSRFRHFALSRQRGPTPPVACAFAVQLQFDKPVEGPIALGYGSHFGLGLFEQSTPD